MYRKIMTLAAFLLLCGAQLSSTASAQDPAPQPQTSPTPPLTITTPRRPAPQTQPQASPTPPAQTQAMPPNEEFRRTAPQPLAPRPINLPTPVEMTLSNGLRVVIVEDARLPLVTYRLAFRTGDTSNPADTPGLLDFVNDMMTEGTQTRTSRQLAEELARIGASLSVASNADYTTIAASSLAQYNDQLLGLMADVLLRPSFPQAELDLLKNNTKQALQLQRSQPGFLQNERFARALYGNHPYSVTSTTPEAVDRITRERLVQFHRQVYVPGGAVLIVVGNVQREALMRRLNELLGDWRSAQGAAAINFPAPPARNARTIYLVDRPRSEQSSIAIGNLGIARTSADYFPVTVMNTILGGGLSSRLDANLRENKGYTYGARSDFDARRAAGTFRAAAEVQTRFTGDSLREFFFELDRIRTGGVTEEELNSAKAFLSGIFPLRLETQEGLINNLVAIKMFDLPANYLQTYRDRVNAVTREQVQQAARQYVQSDRAAIVIVGDAAQIMEQIRPYAPNIEVYDAQGNRRETPAATTTTTTTTTPAPTGTGNTTDPPPTTNTPATVNAVGSWTIEAVASNGEALPPATLSVTREGDTLRGQVESQLGNIALSNVALNGNNFTAAMTFEGDAQMGTGQLEGRIEGDRMTGTITFANGVSLNFTGTRARQP